MKKHDGEGNLNGSQGPLPVTQKISFEGEAITEEELKPLNQPENCDTFSLNNVQNGKNQRKRKTCDDFDEILELIGGKDKYQKIILYGVLCPIVAVTPFILLNTIFMYDVPDHWCLVPGRDPSMSLEEWKNLTIPREIGPDGNMRHSQCKMYKLENSSSSSPSNPSAEMGERETVDCKGGWEYDTSDYSSTIPSEFNWVCSKAHYPTECFAWAGIGSAIGTMMFGILADKYGRRPIFFLACTFLVIFKTLKLFVPQHFTLFKTLGLLSSLTFSPLFTLPALISAEISETDYRAWIYAVTFMIWVVGNSLLPFLAMICRGWFLFGCITAAVAVVFFIVFPILDESSRWLITRGETEKAVKIILKVAKTNRREVDPQGIQEMVEELSRKQVKEQEGKTIGVWTLFSKGRLALHTIMLVIAWTSSMLLYYGLSLNTTHMAGNKFLNFFFLSLIELPGAVVAGKLVDKTGRRWTQVAFFLVCAVFCLGCAVAVTFPNSAVIVLIGALGIKFGVSISSFVAYLLGTEIFPTPLRSTGSGLASTVSAAIGVFGPYIVYSGRIHVSLPYAILGICSMVGLLTASFLPETYKQSLPETVEDANAFGRDHKFWSYLPQAKELKKRNSQAMELGLQKRTSLSASLKGH